MPLLLFFIFNYYLKIIIIFIFLGNNWNLGKKWEKRQVALGPEVTRYTANCFGYFLKTSPRGWKADPTSRQITKLICQRLDLCRLPESLHLIGLGRWYAFSLLSTVVSWMLPFLQLQTLPCCTEELQLLLLGILSKAWSCDSPQRPLHSTAYWNRWGERGVLHQQSTFVQIQEEWKHSTYHWCVILNLVKFGLGEMNAVLVMV